MAGYLGAVLTLCAITALAMVPLFRLARAIAGAWPATAAWLGAAFTVPIGAHAWSVYPEVPAATIAAWSAWWLWSPLPSGAGVWAARGAALAILPWLHTKFLALLVPLTLCLLLRVWKRPLAIIMLGVPIAVSLAGWLWSFWAMYGVASPFIPYGSVNPFRLAWSHVPRGVLGSLFDQEFGLLIYSPIYVLSLAGLLAALRDRQTRRLAVAMCVTAVLFILAVMRVYMWWGGTSAPARFLVPVAVLAMPLMAIGFSRLRGVWTGVATAALVGSVTIWLLMAAQPSRRLLVQNRNASGAFIEYVQGQAPFAAALPSFLEVDWQGQLPRVWVLVTALVLGLFAAYLVGRRSRGSGSAYWGGVAACLTAITALAVIGGRQAGTDVRVAAANQSMTALMMQYDPPRLSAFDYGRHRRVAGRELWGLGGLNYAGDNLIRGRESLLAGPGPLPAGRYQAAFWFGQQTPDATVSVLYDGRPPALLADTVSEQANPAIVNFLLPVTARGIQLVIEPPGLSERVQRVELRPSEIVPRSRRPSTNVPRAIMPIDGRPGGFVCFLDEQSYPERPLSWVRAGRTASLLVVPAGASLVRVKLENGAAKGPVTVVSAGQQTRLDLAAWEARDVYVPVPSGERTVALDITPANGFRPADVDSQSEDRRYLGCRFGIELLK